MNPNPTVNDKQKLKTLYQALRDRPLNPGDAADRRWYVPYLEHFTVDPIAEIQSEISFNDSQSLCFVTGQRGTGKSTELLRLKKRLDDDGVVVFYVDMLDYQHMSVPAEISDFLIAVSASLVKQADDNHDLGLERSYWAGISDFLSRVGFDTKATLKLGSGDLPVPGELGVDITARLKDDSSFKHKLQQATHDHIFELVNQVHDLSSELVVALRHKYRNPDLQVAVIVDSFEQIRGRYDNAKDVFESVVRLFGTDGKHLNLPQMHMVITVPPYLNAMASGATKGLGNAPKNLPAVHVRNFNSMQADDEGLRVLLDMLHQRSPDAESIFTPDALKELAIASGGDLRDYFVLVRNVLVKAGTRQTVQLPLSGELIALAKEQMQRSMLPIDDQSVRWLYKIHQTGQTELEQKDKLPELAALFDNSLVINYQNGESWYGIHPLIIDYVSERQKVLDERGSKE